MACTSAGMSPVPIEDGDICTFCKMAISEKQFASEIITDDERVLKFDDIGCLLRYRQQAGVSLAQAAIFVTDHEGRQWLKAEDAFFTRSKTIKTPMGSGIIASADGSKAGNESVRFQGLKP
jgi:copper chaperone NosL